jgi:hypothetical protein
MRASTVKTAPKILFTTIVAMAALSGCGLSAGPAIEGDLAGTWTWVEASGGIAGVTNTPESTGTTMSLLIRPSGTVRLRRSGMPDRTVAVELQALGDSAYEIRYAEPLFDFDTQVATLPEEDELVLTDPCCDGFVWRFQRAP